MIGVHHDSRVNSQAFTNCCGVAICADEARCPKCKEEVQPGVRATNAERERWRWGEAYGKSLRGIFR